MEYINMEFRYYLFKYIKNLKIFEFECIDKSTENQKMS